MVEIHRRMMNMYGEAYLSKTTMVEWCSKFNVEVNNILEPIVVGNESWCRHWKLESKASNIQWCHPSSQGAQEPVHLQEKEMLTCC
ncbi:hypothetical protein CEXT_320671 [Caerostris extrusa]|uniref:Transposase n=1 Tax=Caerostris extrusa TaxID=172846 RepID=A0AAV4V2Y2_CAEEX|nr:hypothetical protein CEXT_320671 [Caerostris extrusa]